MLDSLTMTGHEDGQGHHVQTTKHVHAPAGALAPLAQRRRWPGGTA
ncbi:hypothetical protein ABZ215_14575 [Amycolatopsis sp. NPDC006131]